MASYTLQMPPRVAHATRLGQFQQFFYLNILSTKLERFGIGRTYYIFHVCPHLMMVTMDQPILEDKLVNTSDLLRWTPPAVQLLRLALAVQLRCCPGQTVSS